MERNLCLHGNGFPAAQEVTVVVSSSSAAGLAFSVRLFEVDDFAVGLNEEGEVRGVTAATPEYRYVDLRDADTDFLLNVRVDSRDGGVCAIVSVQPPGCPVSDTEDVVRNEGSFQSMLSVASFNFDMADYAAGGYEGVYVVFLVTADDALCVGGAGEPAPGRTKSFTFNINDGLSKYKIAGKVAASVSVLAALAVLAVASHCLFPVFGEKSLNEKLDRIKDGESGNEVAMSSQPPAAPGEEEDRIYENLRGDPRRPPGSAPLPPPSPPPSPGGDAVDGAVVSRLRLPKYVSELAQKSLGYESERKYASAMFQKSGLHVWLLVIMGTFYTIPAVQVVFNQQTVLQTTGNQDVCYYNFLCSAPVLAVTDFNHIFSNIWYMGFGVIFVVLTWHRQWKRGRALELMREAGIEPKYGLPQHFGIFYAMGLGIVFEGVLSSCYHVCPTNENFQFDTTFMYLTSVLAIIKIYQFRHPDIVSKAYKVFLCLACVMLLEVIGIYFESTLFWVLTLLGYSLVCVVLTFILYHSGEYSLNYKVFWNMYKSAADVIEHRNFAWTARHVVLVLLINGINFALILYGAVSQPDISSYLLYVFIGNLMVYTSYYITMKIVHKETITVKPIVYMAVAVVCWVPALYFFNQVTLFAFTGLFMFIFPHLFTFASRCSTVPC